jgi:hypothetical protein
LRTRVRTPTSVNLKRCAEHNRNRYDGVRVREQVASLTGARR